MGFYARTCGISNTAIEIGEPVVVILLNFPYTAIPLDKLIRKARQQKIRFSDSVSKIYWDKKYEEVCNDTSPFPTELPFDIKPIIGVVEGTYDGSGFIKKMERPETCYYLMFHKWAVESILPEYNAETKGVTLACNILIECDYIRRSPMDWIIGKQYRAKDEIEKQIALNEKTNLYLKSKLKEYENS
jgi:hypothetical protein